MLHTRRGAVALAATLIGLGLPTAAPATAIVGGNTVGAAAYPWLGAVGSPLFLTRPSGQFCGGTLIGPDRVLTAAHCVEVAQFLPQALTVTFGRSELNSDDGVSVRVKDIHIHPDFRNTDFDGDSVHHNDVAILTIERPQPGPFAEIGAPHGDSGKVLGWGATAEGDSSNSVLRAATVPLVAEETCATVYGTAFDRHDMFCAGSTAADSGEFDSGGPLLVDGRVAGLTSWAKGSARPGYPGVYSRITELNF
ncbi:S1 family peptidase [Nocardia australiensis]|uniref:S1 family peptidase n=1 Tax=Nocardia australiensis TaxID=2887191 RepID=UPI001D135DA4|nr:serine protease [Nocardia australiensis]